MRQETQRQQAAAQAAAKQEAAARQEAAEREAARQSAQTLAATNAAQARDAAALGKAGASAAGNPTAAVADASASAQRGATASTGRTAPSASLQIVEKPPQARMESARRATLMGRVAQDLRLQMVAEGWRQRVEQNAPFDVLQAAKNGPYENPVVTVALRRDGSLESVVINRSSGVPAIDNAVRRIVLMLSPFAPFTSDLAMDYDVIEIRRVWTFDTAVRLVYGGH